MLPNVLTAPLLLDGAMGTMLQRLALTEADFRGELLKDSPVNLKGNNDVLNLTRPDAVEGVHRAYLEAGADIICTNTFSSQRISQAEYGLGELVERMNMEGARIARRVADEFTAKTGRKRYVAGSVGPTTRLLSISADAEHPERRESTFDALEAAYFEQISALIRGGVDAILVETALDAINAKAAMNAALRAMEAEGRQVSLMLSITVTDSAGRVLSGQTVESFAISLSHIPLYSIGLNCSMGAAAMSTPLRRLAESACCKVSVHPNAGLPNRLGEYEDTPQMMSKILQEFVEDGIADIIGGCCGTTPEHIDAFRHMLDSLKDYREPLRDAVHEVLRISGMEPVRVAPGEFLNVGERCNVAGSRKFLRLIKEGNLEEAVQIARKQVEDGAMAIDINMDDGLLDAGKCMEEFVNLLASDPVASKVPLMIDSSDFAVILRGVKCSQGKPIVNSISLKEGEKEFLRRARLLRRLGAAVIVMAFDEEGQAVTFDRKTQICARSYRLLVEEAGYEPSDIIFDPNILTVATGLAEHADYALDYVRAAQWIHQNLPGCRVSGGLSNLSFAFRGNNYLREAMHAVFLHRAVPMGLDMAILNAATSMAYSDVPPELARAIEDVLFDKRTAEATERLSAMGMEILRKEKEAKGTSQAVEPQATDASPHEALVSALVKGNTSAVETPLKQLLETESPLSIIAGPLMEGMNLTGKLFGEGKIFLPQVVKTARTMKFAVDILQPYLRASESAEAPDAKVNYTGTALLATVKGDVHDIGKNIVGMILACNNFKIVDLGVMVPPDAIIEAVKREKPDFICLSGLITPSLREMTFTVEALGKEGINIPVMVGGAATSELHTALKIAPGYAGAVFHLRDAAQNPIIGTALTDPSRREKTISELKQRQEQLQRDAADTVSREPLRREAIDTDSPTPTTPQGLPEIFHIPVSVLIDRIDWLYFFHAWKVKGNSEEGRKLKAEAEEMLGKLAKDTDCYIAGKMKFVHAAPDGDTIKIEGETFTADRRKGLSLADFLHREGESVGLFAATIGPKLREFVDRSDAEDVYAGLLAHTLCDRLVEAAAGWMQHKTGWDTIRPAIGYPSLPDQSNIFRLDRLLNLSAIGIALTETGAMNPPSSVAGLIMPRGKYF